MSQFLPNSEQKSNVFTKGLRGVTIELLTDVSNINVQEGSIFDIVQNIWSFSMVVFTILVVKLTKYINLKQK